MERAIAIRNLAYKFVKQLIKKAKKKLTKKHNVKWIIRKQGKVHHDHTYALQEHSLSRPNSLISSLGYASSIKKSSDKRVPKLIVRPKILLKVNRVNKDSDKVIKPWVAHPLSMGHAYRLVRAAFYRDFEKEKVRAASDNKKKKSINFWQIF